MFKKDKWPFDQPRDAVAVVDVDVVEGGAPVLLVTHYTEDGSWASLSGGAFEPERARLVTMAELVAQDASLLTIADLPPGWTATRERVGAAWDRQLDPDI